MNKYILLVISISFLFLYSCQKDFLRKPLGGDLNVDSVFSTKQKSLAAIAQAYSFSLASGIPVTDWDNNREYGLRSSTLSHLSGEVNALKFDWEDGWMIQRSGMTANDGSGIPMSPDGFVFNYKCIRHNYLVIENIDKVVDMSDEEKKQVKAEMKVLIAYRYQEMFKRYGGVPIVTSSLSVEDEINTPRSNLQEVVNHVIKLCDEAFPDLVNVQPLDMKGRVTKGIALAVKSEILLYAARPLFNSASPYLSLTNNSLINYGNYDPQRWKDAALASVEVINWANNNGIKIINTGNPFDDYATAVATPGNAEILLAYKNQVSSSGGNGGYFDPRGQSGGANGMSFYQLTQYLKADGSEQNWPAEDVSLPYSDYNTKINEMEPRYKASAMGAGIDPWNNPNDVNWNSSRMSDASTWADRAGTEACGRRVKFWYKAGVRIWFEFPIYRLAEFYLSAAEAYNELDQPALSLQYLNVIRSRAGLPLVNITDKEELRKIIQREWAVEFYEEGHRLFDVKHWKLADIGKGIIGGSKKSFVFTYKNGQFGRVAGWQKII